MLDTDFDDNFIEKLSTVICGDDYYEKFCDYTTRTKCPVYRTGYQLEKFFEDIVELKFEKGDSRTQFTIRCLSEANTLKKMDIVLEKLTDPKVYLNEKIIKFIIDEVNGIIKWYDIKIKLESNKPKIVRLDESVTIDISQEKKDDFVILDFKQLIRDEILSEIMNQRWLEIKQNYISKSYLSTIVLLGSILEGLLYYFAVTNYRMSMSCSSAPKNGFSEVIPIDNWTLSDLINVAHNCGWIDDDIRTFNDGLRDYRNLIHPKLQKEKLIIPDIDTCNICIKVVIAAFNDLKSKEYLRQ